MCMACQMEDELWFAYLDQVARQEKAAAEAADPATGVASGPASDLASNLASNLAPAKKPAPASPFVCEEPPSE
jgi:hypothetical protein